MSDSQTGVSRVEDMLEHQCYGIAAEQQKNVACLKGGGGNLYSTGINATKIYDFCVILIQC